MVETAYLTRAPDCHPAQRHGHADHEQPLPRAVLAPAALPCHRASSRGHRANRDCFMRTELRPFSRLHTIDSCLCLPMCQLL